METLIGLVVLAAGIGLIWFVKNRKHKEGVSRIVGLKPSQAAYDKAVEAFLLDGREKTLDYLKKSGVARGDLSAVPDEGLAEMAAEYQLGGKP